MEREKSRVILLSIASDKRQWRLVLAFLSGSIATLFGYVFERLCSGMKEIYVLRGLQKVSACAGNETREWRHGR